MKKTIVKIGLLLLGIAVFYGVENKETTGFSALVLDNIDAWPKRRMGKKMLNVMVRGILTVMDIKLKKDM